MYYKLDFIRCSVSIACHLAALCYIFILTLNYVYLTHSRFLHQNQKWRRLLARPQGPLLKAQLFHILQLQQIPQRTAERSTYMEKMLLQAPHHITARLEKCLEWRSVAQCNSILLNSESTWHFPSINLRITQQSQTNRIVEFKLAMLNWFFCNFSTVAS